MQAPRARLPLHTRPTVLHFVPQASRSPSPLTQARQAPRASGRRGGRAAEQACPFHIDRAVSTTPTVPDLQRRRSGSFTCFCQKSVLSSVAPCTPGLSPNMSIAAQDCALKIVTLCLCAAKADRPQTEQAGAAQWACWSSD